MRPHIDDGLVRTRVAHRLRALSSDHRTLVTQHEFRLRASRATRLFQRRYAWSGTGVENRPVVDPNTDPIGHATHRLLGPVLYEPENSRLVVVDLGRTLEVGEEVTVRISHRFVDTGGTFNRFLGHTAGDDCEGLTIAVMLPKADWNVTAVERFKNAEKPHQVRKIDAVKQIVGRAETLDHEWVVEKPQQGVSYSIQW